ncbi:hypothetical protein [Kitasatospora sp. NPDC001683]
MRDNIVTAVMAVTVTLLVARGERIIDSSDPSDGEYVAAASLPGGAEHDFTVTDAG